MDLSAVQQKLARREHIRILGVDPGSRLCGYAFVTARAPYKIGPAFYGLDDVGVIRADLSLGFCQRIGLIHTTLNRLVSEHRPDVCVIEDAFFGLNARSALKLGQARGALVTAASREGVPVVEVSPACVKKAIVGCGAAEKVAVSEALKVLIGFDRGQLPFDVCDALAIALTYGANILLQGLRIPATNLIGDCML